MHHVEKLKAGQVRKYGDSIYEYRIVSDEPVEAVKSHCTTKLRPSKNESPNGHYGGSCGFPFGLESYFKFKKESEGVYLYTVCEPYCD